MGYVLLLLFFLIWRNMVQIRKAANYIAYGMERRKGIIRKGLDLLADIRADEVRKAKERKAKLKVEVEENEVEKPL